MWKVRLEIHWHL